MSPESAAPGGGGHTRKPPTSETKHATSLQTEDTVL